MTLSAAKYEVSATKWYKIHTLSNCRVFVGLCCLFALAGTICLCQGFVGFSCTPACRCVASRLIRHCTSMYNISHMPYTIAYRIRNCWMLLGLDSAIKWQSAGDIVAVLLLLLLQLVIVVVVVIVVICHRSSVANCSSVKEGEDTEEGGKWDIREANCTCEGCSDCCTFWFQLTRGSFKWPFWVAADAAAVQATSPPVSLPTQWSKAMSSCRPSAAFSLLCLLKIYAVYATPTVLSPQSGNGQSPSCIGWRWWCGKRGMKQLFRAEASSETHIHLPERSQLLIKFDWAALTYRYQTCRFICAYSAAIYLILI